MDECRKAAERIAAHTIPLSEESVVQLTGILVRRELSKGDFFCKREKLPVQWGWLWRVWCVSFIGRKNEK